MEIKYSLIQKKQAEHPVRQLIKISGDRNFIASLSAFGPAGYKKNIAEMQKQYSHPETRETISFRPATTAETILINPHYSENEAEPEIFEPVLLQAGWIVKTPEGVFANPPKDKKGNHISDEKTLKSFLKTNKKVNGIYLLNNDFGFAPYETFKMGKQDYDIFTRGGLARILEYSEEKTAKNLRIITSHKFFKEGVYVSGFDNVKEPILKVIGFDSGRNFNDYCFCIDGNWNDHYNGFSLGVLDSGKATVKILR